MAQILQKAIAGAPNSKRNKAAANEYSARDQQ
jgi:hypothetical protein